MAGEVRKADRDLVRKIVKYAKRGLSQRAIAEKVGCHQKTVWRKLDGLGGVFRLDWRVETPGRLSLDDRVAIAIGLAAGVAFAALARELGFVTSTISREVDGNGGRGGYRPLRAHDRAFQRARRPKATKLVENPLLLARVVDGLQELWSPEQISAVLRHAFPDDASMWVSHETIYKSLYVQGRGELRRELARCLRTGRAKRKAQGRLETRGKIPNMVSISDRPAEAEDRAVPGHWEGDLIIGRNGASAIGTLVERSTRFVMLLHLPHGKNAEHVRDVMSATIQTLPASLRRSLTWDQGTEMAQHERFTIETDVPVYFCDPHSPWQRGTNENTNGLLRQYFPKGTDLSVHDAATLRAAADSLNRRPRKTLGWKTPAQALAALIATTD